MNRRDLLKSGVLTVLPVMIGWPIQALAASPIRENIRDFSQSPAKVAALRRAVDALTSRPLTDIRSWFNMAAIHDISPTDPNIPSVPQPVQALWRMCHHDENLFFVWHRAYIWSMEKLMQDAVGDTEFRLPYWDWYEDPTLPAIFRDEIVGGVKNPLHRSERYKEVNQGAPIWQPEVDANFAGSSFFDFQDSLNYGEHGAIHMAIGTLKNMANPETAARDPIFWLHHANIDRLLMVWLNQGGNRSAPGQFNGWQPSQYRFPTSASTLMSPTVAQLALDKVEGPDYDYASLTMPKPLGSRVPSKPTRITGSTGTIGALGMTTQSVSARKNVSIAGSTTIPLRIVTAKRRSLEALSEGETPGLGQITSLQVVLSNVSLATLPPKGVLAYRIFVDLPQTETGDSSFRNHYLGTISLFELIAGRSMQGHEQPRERRFSVTAAFARAARSKSAMPSNLDISIVPVMAPDVAEPEVAVLKIREVRIEASTLPIE